MPLNLVTLMHDNSFHVGDFCFGAASEADFCIKTIVHSACGGPEFRDARPWREHPEYREAIEQHNKKRPAKRNPPAPEPEPTKGYYFIDEVDIDEPEPEPEWFEISPKVKGFLEYLDTKDVQLSGHQLLLAEAAIDNNFKITPGGVKGDRTVVINLVADYLRGAYCARRALSSEPSQVIKKTPGFDNRKWWLDKIKGIK